MVAYEKPLPLIREETMFFWEGCKRYELLFQKCVECGTYRFPPRAMCHHCQSEQTELVKSSGKGTVHSFTVLEHTEVSPLHPAFIKDAPYAVVLVELPDVGGLHILSNLVDCRPENIAIGMPVEVIFDDVTSELSLPKFKLVR